MPATKVRTTNAERALRKHTGEARTFGNFDSPSESTADVILVDAPPTTEGEWVLPPPTRPRPGSDTRIVDTKFDAEFRNAVLAEIKKANSTSISVASGISSLSLLGFRGTRRPVKSTDIYLWDVIPLAEATLGSLQKRRRLGRSQFLETVFEDWPRLMQIASIGLVFLAAILSVASTISTSVGLAGGFLALSFFFFANFGAWRRGGQHWLVGPTIATLGTWGSTVIALAITANAVLNS